MTRRHSSPRSYLELPRCSQLDCRSRPPQDGHGHPHALDSPFEVHRTYGSPCAPDAPYELFSRCPSPSQGSRLLRLQSWTSPRSQRHQVQRHDPQDGHLSRKSRRRPCRMLPGASSKPTRKGLRISLFSSVHSKHRSMHVSSIFATFSLADKRSTRKNWPVTIGSRLPLLGPSSTLPLPRLARPRLVPLPLVALLLPGAAIPTSLLRMMLAVTPLIVLLLLPALPLLVQILSLNERNTGVATARTEVDGAIIRLKITRPGKLNASAATRPARRRNKTALRLLQIQPAADSCSHSSHEQPLEFYYRG